MDEQDAALRRQGGLPPRLPGEEFIDDEDANTDASLLARMARSDITGEELTMTPGTRADAGSTGAGPDEQGAVGLGEGPRGRPAGDRVDAAAATYGSDPAAVGSTPAGNIPSSEGGAYGTPDSPIADVPRPVDPDTPVDPDERAGMPADRVRGDFGGEVFDSASGTQGEVRPGG